MNLKHRNIISILFLLLSALPLMAAGKQETQEIKAKTETLNEPIIITDSLGRKVVFEKTAETIITMLPSANEAVKILGAWDKVIGRDAWTTDAIYFPNLEQIPTITGPQGSIDFEKLIALNPDLFFMSLNPGMDPLPIIDQLEPEVKVVVLDMGDAETLSENMEILGRILGKESEAARYAAFNNEILNLINSRTATLSDEEKPKVFLKSEGYTADQLCTMTNASPMVTSLLGTAGGINIAADLPGVWIQDVDREWLINQNIEVILVPTWNAINPGIWGYDIESPDVAKEVQSMFMSMDVFKDSSAVKNGRVYLCDSMKVLSPAAAVSILRVAVWLHPSLFTDIDPKNYLNRYMTDYIGADVDLAEKGLFAWPAN